MTSTTATARTTYLVGTTNTGTKIHKAYRVENGAVFSNCGTGNSCLYSRGRQGWITSTTEIETGTVPVGALCSKCFPGVTEIAAPVSAPVAAPAPKPAARPVAAPAEMISFEEAFALISAAGHAEMVGGAAWVHPGEIDKAAVLEAIAGWNA